MMDADTRRSHYSRARNGGALTPKQRRRVVKKLLHQSGQLRKGAGQIEDVPLPATVDEVQQFTFTAGELMLRGLARIPVRLGRKP